MRLKEREYGPEHQTVAITLELSGYYGELVITGDLTPRWVCWFASMAFFLYIVYELLVSLSTSTASEAVPPGKGRGVGRGEVEGSR